jgi:hypothetical protein
VRHDFLQACKWLALAGGMANRDHVAKRLAALQLGGSRNPDPPMAGKAGTLKIREE